MENYQKAHNLVLFHMDSFVKTMQCHANYILRKDGFGLRLEQLPVLMSVYYNGLLCQQEIADAIGRDKSSVQRTLVSLLKQQLVSVSADMNDKRRNLVSLTAIGFNMAQKLHAELLRLDNLLFSHISEKDKSSLVRLIRKLERSITDKTKVKSPPFFSN